MGSLGHFLFLLFAAMWLLQCPWAGGCCVAPKYYLGQDVPGWPPLVSVLSLASAVILGRLRKAHVKGLCSLLPIAEVQREHLSLLESPDCWGSGTAGGLQTEVWGRHPFSPLHLACKGLSWLV